ncbi:hypothetical protein PENTCL1PPCAC_4424, partial [Pristionchus entomophagus]
SNGQELKRDIKIEDEDSEMLVDAPITLEIPTTPNSLPNKRLRRARQVLDPSPIPAPSPSGASSSTAAAASSTCSTPTSAGATATVTITTKPIDLPLMLGSITSVSPIGRSAPMTPAPTTSSSTASDHCNVTDPKTGEVESLEQYMTCRKCGCGMRAVMRRHRVNGSLIQFPALRCTKKGCQTFKSLRAISGEVMPRTFVHSEERGDEEARQCLMEWRNQGMRSDEGIRSVMETVKNRLVYEKKSIDKRIRIMNELQTWYNDLPPSLKNEVDDDGTTDPRSRFHPSQMGGRSMPDFLVHLLKWDNDKKIRVEMANVPDGYWSPQDFEFSSPEEAHEQKALLSDASKALGLNLDGMTDCCRQTARRTALLPSIDPLLSAEVLNKEAIEAAAPSPSDTAGSVFKTLLNQKKRQTNGAVLANAVQRGIKSSHIREVSTVESILSQGDPIFTAVKAKRAKSDASLMNGTPRAYNSLSKGLELQRKRSGLPDDQPPPIKAWKKVNGEWRPMDVDDPTVKEDDEKMAEFREKLENDEKWRGKRRAMKEEQNQKKRAKRMGDEASYKDWIIEERARMTQLAEIERDIDEQEMLKEDFDASAPTLETPRKRSMRKKELDKRLADLQERKGWMENELDERRKEMAVVKANLDAATSGGAGPPLDLREALSGALSGDIDVNTLLLSISGASSSESVEGEENDDDEPPPLLSANDTIAGLLAKIKTPC